MSRGALWLRTSVPFVLMVGLLIVLWLAGGASRADAFGQVIVRASAVAGLATALLVCNRHQTVAARPVWWLLGASALLVAAQLIPLPPELWPSLPGRANFAEAGLIAAGAQPWRPMAIVPGAALNALASLLVPLLTLVLFTRLPADDRDRLPGLLLAIIAASTVLGLLQFSGVRIDNPFINDTPGFVSGSFANRNHFALFLAIGCVVAPGWAFLAASSSQWRVPVALGLVLLFVLTILATGSRAGIVLGAVGVAAGFAITWRNAKRQLSQSPRWVFPVLLASCAGVVALVIGLSFAADRAVSIDRMFEGEVTADMRGQAFGTVREMIGTYFPAGSGFGSFDPLFRLHEPTRLLQPSYFNHAHNDFLEIVLDGGLAGTALLIAAIGWWVYASVRHWRSKAGSTAMLGKMASAVLLLLLLASSVDYPARTPMMMAVLVLVSGWLAQASSRSPSGSPLRETGRNL